MSSPSTYMENRRHHNLPRKPSHHRLLEHQPRHQPTSKITACRNPPKRILLRAPVSGSTLGAAKGTIAFFLGWTENDPQLQNLNHLLSIMGKQIIPCGALSLSVAAKLCNNYLSGLITVGSAEALNMGIRAGLHPRVLPSVFAAETGQNAICERFSSCSRVVADAPS